MEYDDVLTVFIWVGTLGYPASLAALEGRLKFLRSVDRFTGRPLRLLGATPLTNVEALLFVFFGRLPSDSVSNTLALSAGISFGLGTGGALLLFASSLA